MTTMTTTEQTIGRGDYGTLQTVTVLIVEGGIVYRTAAGAILEPCGKCASEPNPGTLRHFGFTHAGVCYACTGRGYSKSHGSIEDATKVFARRAKAQAKADAKRAAKADAFIANREAKYTEWAQANPVVAEALAVRYAAAHAAPEGASAQGRENAYYAHLDSLSRDERTLTDLALDAKDTYGGLTDGQTSMVTDILARIDAQAVKAQGSHHLGEIGSKITVTGTVVFEKVIEGYYGSKMLVKIEDGTGGTAVMFSTAAWAWAAEKGDAITVTGAVKAHEDYAGVAQTVLSSPKVVKG